MVVIAVVPTLTALLLSSWNDLQFFFLFLYAVFSESFLAQRIMSKCTSRHLFPYGGLPFHIQIKHQSNKYQSIKDQVENKDAKIYV